MHAQLGRRVFIGSVAAGLPMLAVATPFAQTAGKGAKAGSDPVFDHALDELGRIYTRGKARKAFNGEDVRAAAAQLRSAAVYGRQIDVDGRTRKVLREQVARKGRDAFVDQRPDHAKGLADLKRHGIERDPQWRGGPTADYTTQLQELDGFLKNGPTLALERTAALLERVSEELDRQASTQGATLRRVGQSWYSGFCAQLSAEIARLTVEASAVLAVAYFLPDVYAMYLMILAAIAFQTGVYAWTCEWNWSL
jgi:hypothetical protein